MKQFYTLGDHITAADPRGLIKITPRNIGFEIAESLQKLKELKLFDTKEKAEKFAENNAKRDKDKKVISISPCIEVFIIDETLIQKNIAINGYFIAPNQITNIIAQNATVNIPAAIDERIYEINGKREIKLSLANYDNISDYATVNLEKELHKDGNNKARVVADFFNGYVQKGAKHSMSQEDLDNPAINVLASLASKFFTIDFQDWSATIAKTLISNSQWNIDEIHKYLSEWRQKFFKQTKEYTNSIFLKKLDGALIALHKSTLKNIFDDYGSAKLLSYDLKEDEALAQPKADVTSSVAPAAAAPLIPHADESKESSEVSAAISDELKPPPIPPSFSAKDDDFAISFAFGAPLRMFKPVMPTEEKPVDQNVLLEELFKRAKENPELRRFLLAKAKLFDDEASKTSSVANKFSVNNFQ